MASFAKCLEVVDVPKFPAVTNADDVVDNVGRFNAVIGVAIGAQWRIAKDQQPEPFPTGGIVPFVLCMG